MNTQQKTNLQAVLKRVPTEYLQNELLSRGIDLRPKRMTYAEAVKDASSQVLRNELRSRHELWMATNPIAELKCPVCTKQATGWRKCDGCRETFRTHQRNKYRIQHGIPLSAPVKLTKPRKS